MLLSTAVIIQLTSGLDSDCVIAVAAIDTKTEVHWTSRSYILMLDSCEYYTCNAPLCEVTAEFTVEH